ncbi:MAG TPA: hypothetical protein VOB72_07225 [Candidatus Dormibacteraeota bacterium]|nr:hypothetical protein [Candidatus Dormibacteraeota bacterium]
MIDYELMRRELEERQLRARRANEARRLLASGGGRRPWSVRSAVGLGVARIGLRLAGPGAAAALRMGQAR